MGEITNFNSYEFNSSPLSEKLTLLNTTIIGFVKWCIQNKKMRVVGFREALWSMRYEIFSQCDADFFKDIYFSIKGDAERTLDRSLVLEALVLQCLEYDLGDFFLTVFKKERKFSMRLTAIRGYSAYATEAEVAPLMKKFAATFENGSMANCLYQEYAFLLSKFGLPYLVHRYGYACFIEAMQHVDKLYNRLPDELQGLWTYDENAEQIRLLSDEETKRRFNIALHVIGTEVPQHG